MARGIDTMIAKTMWEADAKRPCLWEDLDQEEKAEWEIMATAARLYIVRHLAFVAGQMSLPREHDIHAAIKTAMQPLLKSAIQDYSSNNHFLKAE